MCDCLEGLAKAFLILTNVLICILSLAIIGVCIWLLVDAPSFVNLVQVDDSGWYYFTAGIICLLVVAVFAILISCFGCLGARKNSKGLMGAYTISIGLVLILLITGIILACVTDLEVFKKPMYKSLQDYDPKSNDAVKQGWDETQSQMECCGVESWTDWPRCNENFGTTTDSKCVSSGRSEKESQVEDQDQKGKGKKSKKEKEEQQRKISRYESMYSKDYGTVQMIPKSCCDPSKNQNDCVSTPTTSNGNYHIGCFTKMEEYVYDNAGALIGCSAAILVVMLISFIFGIQLWCCSSSSDRPSKKDYKKAHVSKRGHSHA